MKLGRREQLADHRRGVAVALLLFYRLGLSPALERMRTLDRLVATKERELPDENTPGNICRPKAPDGRRESKLGSNVAQISQFFHSSRTWPIRRA